MNKSAQVSFSAATDIATEVSRSLRASDCGVAISVKENNATICYVVWTVMPAGGVEKVTLSASETSMEALSESCVAMILHRFGH